MLVIVALAFALSTQAQTFTNYSTADGLLHDNVSSVAIASNGDVWFGTQGGVSVFDGSNWTSHTTTTDAGLVDNSITCIAIASNGDVWVGSDFGAAMYDGNSWTTFTTADGLNNDQVKYIAEDGGVIWIGTNTGLSSYNGSTWNTWGTGDGLPFGGVNSITPHSNGDLYLGSGLGGVIIYDGSSFTEITENEGVLNDKIRGIAIDGSGNKWVGTADGITVLDNSDAFLENHTRMFILPNPDTLNPVEDVQIDSEGNVWAAVYVDYLVTEGGVSVYDGNNWVDFDVSDGLAGPVVHRMAIDANDDVWVTTSTGISHISNVSVGIESSQDEVSFQVYPNPTSDVLNIVLETQSEDVQEIEVYTTAMQKVRGYAIQPRQQQMTISVNDLASGIYFVMIGTQVNKIVVR